MLKHSELFNISIRAVERTPEVKKYEKYINNTLLTLTQRERLIEKIQEAIAFGVALKITEEEGIEVVHQHEGGA